MNTKIVACRTIVILIGALLPTTATANELERHSTIDAFSEEDESYLQPPRFLMQGTKKVVVASVVNVFKSPPVWNDMNYVNELKSIEYKCLFWKESKRHTFTFHLDYFDKLSDIEKNELDGVEAMKRKGFNVIIHGWIDGVEGSKYFINKIPWMEALAYEMLSDRNVIILNWGHLAQRDYLRASDEVLTFVTKATHTALNRLIQLLIFDVDIDGDGIVDYAILDGDKLQRFCACLWTIRIYGHSLGAHMAGMIAQSFAKCRISLIVGMDPARQAFTPVKMERHCLSYRDAHRVVIFHASKLFGISYILGHEDYFLNGGTLISFKLTQLKMNLQSTWPIINEVLSHLRVVNVVYDLLVLAKTENEKEYGFYTVKKQELHSDDDDAIPIPVDVDVVGTETKQIEFPIFLKYVLSKPHFEKPKSLPGYKLKKHNGADGSWNTARYQKLKNL